MREVGQGREVIRTLFFRLPIFNASIGSILVGILDQGRAGLSISDVTSYFILHQPRHSFNLVARVTRGSASDSLCKYIERSSRVPSSILY